MSKFSPTINTVIGFLISFVLWGLSLAAREPLLLFFGLGSSGLVQYFTISSLGLWDLFTVRTLILAHVTGMALFLVANVATQFLPKNGRSNLRKGMHFGYALVLISAIVAFKMVVDQEALLAKHQYYHGLVSKPLFAVMASGKQGACQNVRAGDMRAHCVAQFAIAKNNPSLCEQLSDETMPYFSQKDRCFWDIHFSNETNTEVCHLMKDANSAGRCLTSGLQAMKRLNIVIDESSRDANLGLCRKMVPSDESEVAWKSRCFRDMGTAYKDVNICHEITQSTPQAFLSFANTEQDQCIFSVAAQLLNSALCAQIQYEPLRGRCRSCGATSRSVSDYYCSQPF